MSIYKHILLPTDFTEAGRLAAEKAKALVEMNAAELTVLHVIDHVPPEYIIAHLPQNLASESSLVERAKNYLSDWVKTAKLGNPRQIVSVGPPKRMIVELVRKNGFDLVVMGTHAERGLARILGSTTRAVLHDCPCDVLAVHPG